MLPKKLEDWLDQASGQLRSRRAVAAVREELARHLADQYDALCAAGLDPDTAAERTVREMGDPVLVGGQLDRVHRPRPALAAALPLALVLALGSLLQWVLGRMSGTLNSQQVWLGFGDSLPGALAGAALSVGILLLAVRFLDVSLLERWCGAVYLGYFAAAGCWLLLARPVSGRYPLGGTLLLLFVPVWTAVLCRQRGRYLAGLLTAAAAVLPGLLLGIWIAQLQMTVLAGLCCFALCLWCCARDWFCLGARLSAGVVVLGTAAALALFLALQLGGAPLQSLLGRIAIRLNPAADPQGTGYLWLYLDGLHRCSRLVGQGADPALLGGAFAAYPEGFAHSPLFARGSWQLSYIAWRFGLLAAAALAAVCAAGLGLLWRAALRCRSTLARLMASGCALVLSAGLLANLLGNLGLPFDGFVPFFGWGGTLRCAAALLAGLALSAFRTDPLCTDSLPVRSGRRAISCRDGVLTIRLHR